MSSSNHILAKKRHFLLPTDFYDEKNSESSSSSKGHAQSYSNRPHGSAKQIDVFETRFSVVKVILQPPNDPKDKIKISETLCKTQQNIFLETI